MSSIRGTLFYQLPPWLWGFCIFVGTSLPGDYVPKFILFGPDKLIHISVFFVLSILVYRAAAHRKESKFGRTLVATTALITIGYGVFDELHQYFVPGRFPDVFDVFADGVGAFLGLTAMRLYYWNQARREGRKRSLGPPAMP